jgi:undecaprenyl-diphosphatase
MPKNGTKPEDKINESKKPVENVREMAKKTGQMETAPTPVRRFRMILFQGGLILIMIVFLILSFFAFNQDYFGVDLKITLGLQQISQPFFGGVMQAVSWVGFFPQSVIITFLIILLFFEFGFQWESVMGLIAAAVSISSNSLLKILIHRPRPDAALVDVANKLSSYSFPSGHVMYYVGFLGFVWFLIFSLLKHSWKRTLFLVIVGGLILLVGLSRVYLGQHWSSDVLGAYLMGSLVLVANIRMYHWGKSKRFFVN